MAKQIISIGIQQESDWNTDSSYLYQEGFETSRRAYEKDEFHFISTIRVKAEIKLRDNGRIQTIYSMGLYGIDSDSSPTHIKDIVYRELSELSIELELIGFTSVQIAEAMQKVKQ